MGLPRRGRKPGLWIDVEICSNLIVEVGPVCRLSAHTVNDQRDLDESWDGRYVTPVYKGPIALGRHSLSSV